MFDEAVWEERRNLVNVYAASAFMDSFFLQESGTIFLTGMSEAEVLGRALGRAGASGFFRGVASLFLLGDTKGDFESFRYFRDHHRRF